MISCPLGPSPCTFVSCNDVTSSLYSSSCDGKGIIDPVLNSIWTSMYQKSYLFPYSQIVFCLSIISEASPSFSQYQIFYVIRLSAASQTTPPPNLEDQGMPFCPCHHLRPVRHGGPYQELHYHQDVSQDPLTKQVPPLRQIKDTIRGNIFPLFRSKNSYYFVVCYTCKFFSQG